jgi:hypothetical protein
MKLNVWVMLVVGFTTGLGLGVGPARAQAPAAASQPAAAAPANAAPATDEAALAEPPPVLMDAEGVPDNATVTVSASVRAPAPQPAPAPVVTAEVEVDDTDVAALEDFDPYLQDYGVWVDDPKYGTVWVPHPRAVGSRFAPYVSRGHWSLTPTNEWIWVSDYPFGWVVFHYGRWVFTSDNGWSWIPGRRYSHAWVTFRVSDDPYIGWAPMPPSYVWRRGVAVPLGFAVAAAFVFAPIDYAFYPSVQTYVIYDRHRVSRLIGRSYYYAPPGRRAGFYYSPPVSRIPPQARPVRRALPNSQALELRQPRRRVLASAPARVGASARSAVRPVNGSAFRVRSLPQPGAQPRNNVSPPRGTPQRSAPQRSAPQRNNSELRGTPQRSAPQRSAPQRSAPQRSAPQRNNAEPPRSAPQRMNVQQRNGTPTTGGAFHPSAATGQRPTKATPREVPKTVQSQETKAREAPEPRTKPVKPQPERSEPRREPPRQVAPVRRESAPAPRREARPERSRSNESRSNGGSRNRGGGSEGRRR